MAARHFFILKGEICLFKASLKNPANTNSQGNRVCKSRLLQQQLQQQQNLKKKKLGPLVRFYTCASAFSSEARSLHRPAEPDGSGPPSRQTHTPARDTASDSQIKAFHREFVCSSPARRTVLCNAALLKLKSTLAQLRH